MSFTAANAPEVTFIPTYFSTNQSLIRVTSTFNDTVTQVSIYLAIKMVILFHEIWMFLHDLLYFVIPQILAILLSGHTFQMHSCHQALSCISQHHVMTCACILAAAFAF